VWQDGAKAALEATRVYRAGDKGATQTFHPRLLTKKKCCIARSDVRSQPLGIQDSA